MADDTDIEGGFAHEKKEMETAMRSPSGRWREEAVSINLFPMKAA
jgi:hypothetical protein